MSVKPKKAGPIKLRLLEQVRPGGWTVVAGTREQLKGNLGLVIANFPESTNLTFHQSHRTARRRARLLIDALLHGVFQ